MPATVNRIPTRIPTVLIDALSNCRMTRAAAIQPTPTTSDTHQKSATRRAAALASPASIEVPPTPGGAAELLMAHSSSLAAWIDSRARDGRRQRCVPASAGGVGTRATGGLIYGRMYIRRGW